MASSIFNGSVYIHLSFIIFILLLQYHPTIAQLATTKNERLYFNCTVSSNYTTPSTYQKTLNALLTGFSTNIGKNGYYNASLGNITAIALCRGDIELDNCRSCIDLSIRNLTRVCPTEKEAVIWFEYCMFRYTDQPVPFGTMVWGPGFDKWNVKLFVPDQYLSSFQELRRKLFNKLKDNATSSSFSSLRKYATGDDQLENYQAMYSLVQCTPDLSRDQCRACINACMERIPTCCNASVGGAVYKPTCNIRYELGSGSFYDAPVSIDAPSPLPVPDTPASPQGDSKMKNVIIITFAIVVFFVILVAIYILVRLRKNNIRKRKLEIDTMEGMSILESLKYDFDTVKVATDYFSDNNKLGQGGFGPVYKGTLPNGHIFAVKRLAMGSGQGEPEFKNEVLLMAKLQHRNLVRLLGFCLEGEEKLLIYEFVVNGNLDQFIFGINKINGVDKTTGADLDWEKRYKIIGGIARGLQYLHEDSQLRVIHRDLKPSNILLDEDMNAKIADFGMARRFGLDESNLITKQIAGTYGYMAPEVLRGHISPKIDVYSFGVLVLEIVSGKKVSQKIGDGENAESLLAYAWKMWGEGTASNLIDKNILQSSPEPAIVRCIHIGLLCVQENVSNRPTMSSVVIMLSSMSMTLSVPSRPAFVLCNSPDIEKPLLGASHGSSLNGASITELSG